MMQKAITPESLDNVANIVREDLMKRFAGEFVFDPIVVKPDVDEYGDVYLRIMVIFDGDQKRLDPEWTSTMIGRIRPKMIQSGMPDFPTISYVEKFEWDQYMRKAWEKSLLESP